MAATVVLITSRGVYDAASVVGPFDNPDLAQEVADAIEEMHSVDADVATVDNPVPEWLPNLPGEADE